MESIWQLFDELQLIARNGLHYAANSYDRERYERLLELASNAYGLALELPPAEIRARFAAELGQITPKVGANAAIFNDQGRILLVRRADNQRWCLPCGWMEPHEMIADTAVRETWEETGLRVEVRELVDVRSYLPSSATVPHAYVSVLYLCDAVGGELQGSHEGEELAYWELDAVPVWHADHQSYAVAAQAIWRRGRPAAD